MASAVVNLHERGGVANRAETFVPKFVSGIEVMGELVSRRDYSAQSAPLNRSRWHWRHDNTILVQSKMVRTPMLLISNEGTS
jgi:hypothetical protein